MPRWVEPGPGAVAVVPFTNISGLPADDWVGAGIAETLTADLERLDAVSVVRRRGTGRRGARARRREWRRRRRVTPSGGCARSAAGAGPPGWSPGAYQRLGDRVRITARLVDTATGTVAAGARADGAGDEIFTLQDRIGAELAGRARLAGGRRSDARCRRPRARAYGAAQLQRRQRLPVNGNGNGYGRQRQRQRERYSPAAPGAGGRRGRTAGRCPAPRPWRRTSTARSPWAAHP